MECAAALVRLIQNSDRFVRHNVLTFELSHICFDRRIPRQIDAAGTEIATWNSEVFEHFDLRMISGPRCV